jgi:hypothetical protein
VDSANSLARQIREKSLQLASKVGLAILPTLPLLDGKLRSRSSEEALQRLLCLTATAAVSYGFDRAKAYDWLRQEHLNNLLTEAECRFIERAEGNPQFFQVQVEGMWALAWALGIVSQLDFWKDCDSKFVTVLPNLKASEDSAELRSKAHMRPLDDLLSACDLAYCLHWAVRQAELDGKQLPSRLKGYVVVERRRALEWLLSNEPWDAVSLDT